ncbi:MAG: chemotaxis protein CheD [Candidatus Pacebacteria bacterium]|nr:chemotaxis protein CheD [Candidatus Paceibacterota bacterium]
MAMEEIVINMSEMAVGSGRALIRTMSLGSCVAIVIYDQTIKVGGMAHAMLPSQNNKPADVIEEARSNICGDELTAKYADQAVIRLVAELEKMEGRRENFKAKIIGGAKMFRILSGDNKGIGFRNVEAARKQLEILNIPIEGEDVGGCVGRSAEFSIESGLVLITTVI